MHTTDSNPAEVGEEAFHFVLSATLRVEIMNEKERWLQERVNVPILLLHEGEKWCLERLMLGKSPEADLVSCMEVLEVLLSLDALPSLVSILKDESRSFALRKRAAQAIASIGSEYVESELRSMRISRSSDLRGLSVIALGVEN